ncbi:MAG: hypothetical protein K5842_02070 [Bacteroidales bacterium]|nr:hypothetical protein [Bacteroidales bacterium]
MLKMQNKLIKKLFLNKSVYPPEYTRGMDTSLISRTAIVFSLLICLFLTTCNSDVHHIKFKLDEYAFIDKTLEKNLETVIAEQFKDELDVPLDISFENPCGLIVSILDYYKETQRDSVVGTYDVKIETHHYAYYGYVEDSLQNWVKGCCMLAGHLCYIHPDMDFFKPTGSKQRISFYTHNEYCTCSERKVYLNIINNNEVQVVPFNELLDQYGAIYPYTALDEGYDSLIKN